MGKICSKCKQDLPLDRFYRNSSKGDGFNSYCKQCIYEYKKSYRVNNRERINEQQRISYGQDVMRSRERRREYRRNNPDMVREIARRWRQRNPEYVQQWNRTYATNNPVRIKAKTAVNNAVAGGSMAPITEQRCATCDAQAQEYHHWSYKPENWLDVIPLCASCHKTLHIEMKESSQ